ncbi:MAG TPA: hypothetical protein PLJ94_06780 [Methylotenera sp.]|nr:hypothetical protein [Methylotenera sp.]HPH08368.1 hypothetical protein [Methylotenera sp.]HPM48643.1 hypothetical protein [Methylotenera sp.]
MNDELKFPPIPMSQDHIANEFAKSIAGKWCYVHDYKRWFYHDGKEWQMDRVDEIKDMAVSFCRSAVYWPEAAKLSDSQKRALNFYRYIGDILYFAKCDRKIATTAEEIGLPPKKSNYRGSYPCP